MSLTFGQNIPGIGFSTFGGVNILHGIPFLLGGTRYTPAIRTFAEIEQWVSIASHGLDDISATRKAFANSLRASAPSTCHEHIIRLPVSLVNPEKFRFLSRGSIT